MRVDFTIGILSVAAAAPIASWFSRRQPIRSDMNLGGSLVGCSILDGVAERTVFTKDTFEFLRSVYLHVVTNDADSVIDYPTGGGFKVPFEVVNVPGKGRGVFAKERIPRNTLIWQNSHYAEFRDEESLRLFLSAISSNFELSCDILQWAYVADFYRGDYHVGLDLDEGSYINHAEDGKANIGCSAETLAKNPDVDDPDCWGEYALRDIEAGEELVVDYTEFYQFGKLTWFDKMVSEAWARDEPDNQIIATEESPRWHYR